MVQVAENLVIPDGELTFVADRSSGPGGQNVNKVNTRVTLLFDVEGSTVLSAQQRMLLRQRLSGRIGKTGILRVVSQRHRTQLANRAAVRGFGRRRARADAGARSSCHSRAGQREASGG